MKLDVFVRKQKDQWYRLSRLLDQNENRLSDSDELSELIRLHRAVCSDFAYVKSRFPHSAVARDLNSIVQRAHAVIYGYRVRPSVNWFRLGLQIAREAFARSRRLIFLSTTIFVVGMVLAFLSCWLNPDMPRHLLGDHYVDMTIANIHKDDPFAVYKSESSPLMSSFIMTNNIKVTFFAFALGIFLGIGTIYVLFYNGLILGAFFHIFYEHDLLFESYLTLMMHGTIELSCIFIAGGAGLLLGKGFLFPGLLPRVQAIRENALLAIRLLLSTVPLLVLAGIVEGFVTRLELPAWMKMVFLATNVGFLWWFYVGGTRKA